MQLSYHGTDVLFALYQTFVYLSRGKKSDVHFSAHHFYCGMITDWEKTVWRFLWKHFRKSQSLFSIKEIRLCYLFVALCFTIHFSIQSVADKCSIHRWQKPTDSFHPMSVLHARFRLSNTDLGAPQQHWAFSKSSLHYWKLHKNDIMRRNIGFFWNVCKEIEKKLSE